MLRHKSFKAILCSKKLKLEKWDEKNENEMKTTWAILTMNSRNLGCKPACFLSLLATGLLRVFNANVPSFRNGSTIPSFPFSSTINLRSDTGFSFFFFFFWGFWFIGFVQNERDIKIIVVRRRIISLMEKKQAVEKRREEKRRGQRKA